MLLEIPYVAKKQVRNPPVKSRILNQRHCVGARRRVSLHYEVMERLDFRAPLF